MMTAKMKTKSRAQALLDMAKDEAKIADAVEAARRPSPPDAELGRSLPQEAVGHCTSETPPPSTSSAPLPPKSLVDDDEERSGGSSLDDSDIPPPVPPPPSVVAMVPSSARSESNRASIEATMMQATAGLGDASRRTMLAADVPRAGVPSQAQALLDTADAAAEANIVQADDRRPSYLGIASHKRPAAVTIMPRGEYDREERHRHQQRERRHRHRHHRTGDGDGEGRERRRHRRHDRQQRAATAEGDVSDRDRDASFDGGGGASDGLVSSLPQEAAGRCSSDDPPPSTSSATLPPKSCCPWNPAPSALAAPDAHDSDLPHQPSAPPLELLMEDGFFDGPTDDHLTSDAPTTRDKGESALAAPDAHDSNLPPQPSAPPLELLMEDGFFDGPTDDHLTSDAPSTRDKGESNRGHARMTPLAEAAVVLMPVCEAIPTAGTSPALDEEDNDVQAGWPVKCGKYMMVGVASLVFVSVGTLIAVVVVMVGFTKQDDPVTTSTSSTALMTSTTSTAIMTSTTSIAITISASSTSSTITPEMNNVSEESTDFMLAACFIRRLTSHVFIFRSFHLTSSPSPPPCPLGSNRVKQSSEMLLMMHLERRWLSLLMPGLW